MKISCQPLKLGRKGEIKKPKGYVIILSPSDQLPYNLNSKCY